MNTYIIRIISNRFLKSIASTQYNNKDNNQFELNLKYFKVNIFY